MAQSVYVFDAYGTLFDVHAAVRKHAEAVGPDGARLSEIWRQKQLEYSWVRALMNEYQDFWSLTEQALDYAFSAVPTADASTKPILLEAYMTLDCYEEVPQVLKQLKEAGATLAILSNGSPQMLEAAVQSAGIDQELDEILSVDPLKVYKPAESVYELVTTQFKVFPEDVSFQSSNRWDIAGATSFGFRTVWINRAGVPDEYIDLSPAAVLPSLETLPML